jgi:quercetin dioxygenase-like cupin family protein
MIQKSSGGITMGSRVVRRVEEHELLESPDGGMRDSVLISNATCGAKDLSGGLVWISPGATIHEDSHPFDEAYYVVRGDAEVTVAGKTHVVTTGDVVFLPAEAKHVVHNPGSTVFEIFWCIGGPWGQLPGVENELARWPRVDAATGWHRG